MQQEQIPFVPQLDAAYNAVYNRANSLLKDALVVINPPRFNIDDKVFIDFTVDPRNPRSTAKSYVALDRALEVQHITGLRFDLDSITEQRVENTYPYADMMVAKFSEIRNDVALLHENIHNPDTLATILKDAAIDYLKERRLQFDWVYSLRHQWDGPIPQIALIMADNPEITDAYTKYIESERAIEKAKQAMYPLKNAFGSLVHTGFRAATANGLTV